MQSRIIPSSNDITDTHIWHFSSRPDVTHQIRVHMASIGHPIIGDPVYGLKKDRFSNIGGQCLHAAKLTLTHPKTGERMEFSASLPQHFTEVFDKLERMQ